MKITYEQASRAMYFYLGQGVFASTLPLSPQVLMDVTAEGLPLGLEWLFVPLRITSAADLPLSYDPVSDGLRLRLGGGRFQTTKRFPPYAEFDLSAEGEVLEGRFYHVSSWVDAPQHFDLLPPQAARLTLESSTE